MPGIREVWNRFWNGIIGAVTAGPSSEARGEPTAPPPAADRFVPAEGAAPVSAMRPIGTTPAARLAAARGTVSGADGASDYNDMVDRLELIASHAKAPESVARWVAAFAMRRFRPKDEDEGKWYVSQVAHAYLHGLEQYAITTLGFAFTDRAAHDAVRKALQEIGRREFDGPFSSLAAQVRILVDHALGLERVEWSLRLRSELDLPWMRRSTPLRERIAIAAVFGLGPSTYEEALAHAQRIAAVGGALYYELVSLGMPESWYAAQLVEEAMLAGLDMNASRPFDAETAKDHLFSLLETMAKYLEPDWTTRGRRTFLFGGHLENGDQFHDRLMAVRRNWVSRLHGPKDSHGPASPPGDAGGPVSPAGGAGPAPAKGAAPFSGIVFAGGDTPTAPAADEPGTDAAEAGAADCFSLLGAEGATPLPPAVPSAPLPVAR